MFHAYHGLQRPPSLCAQCTLSLNNSYNLCNERVYYISSQKGKIKEINISFYSFPVNMKRRKSGKMFVDLNNFQKTHGCVRGLFVPMYLINLVDS